MENNKHIANENFDWNAYETDADLYGQMGREGAAAAYDQSLNNITAGEVVEGVVTSINKREVIVNVGYKSDGVIPVTEFRYNPELAIGEKVEVYVENAEDKKGQLILSHKKARQLKSWDRVNQALENDEIIKGFIKCRTKGGMIVDVFGIEAFLPGSQIDVKPIRDYDIYVEKTMEFKVVKINQEFRKKRIALGLKQLTAHPWEALDADLKVGDKVTGKVVMMYDYGAFVEVAPGVEGLIHVSEMSWNQHLRSAQEFMKVGDEIEAVVLTLDREERKMSLGIKQLTSDPWEAIEERYPIGSKHTAKVRNFTNFGIFVEIAEGIDGLVHISDLSWTKKIKHPAELTQLGADLDVIVLGIDKENRRLSLGHKQLEENPWNEFEAQYAVDSVHEGKVIEVNEKGAVVALGENVEGFASSKQIVKEDGTTAKVGDVLPFKVTEFSKVTKHISLSHTRVYEEVKRAEENAAKAEKRAAAEATKSTVKKINASVEKTTLGDIAGLAELKAKMEAAAEEK